MSKENTMSLYVRITRTIHYVKYGLTGEDSIASSDVVQDGKSNIIHSNNSHVKDFNKEIDGHNQIAYDVITGLMADSNESISMLRTYVIFGDQTNPAIDNWMTPDSDVTATVTLGPDRTTPYPNESQLSAYSNNSFYDYMSKRLWHGYYDENGQVHHKILPGKEALLITITYYHNQPVDLSFVGVDRKKRNN